MIVIDLWFTHNVVLRHKKFYHRGKCLNQ